MANEAERTLEAIDGLREVLPTLAPQLWAGFREPISAADLDQLRRQTEPWELPPELVTWLRFADGNDGGRFPIIESYWLNGASMASSYEGDLEFHQPGLLPVSYESHVQASIELGDRAHHAIVDTTVDSDRWQILAPSLADVLEAIADLARDGFLRGGYPPAGAPRFDEEPLRTMRAAWTERLAAADWSGQPFVQGQLFASQDGPERWGPRPETGYVISGDEFQTIIEELRAEGHSREGRIDD